MDRLIEAIDNTQNPSVVGLDPTEALVPPQVVASFADEVRDSVESPEEVESAQLAVAYFEYNRTIIDAIADIVPAVKPQIAMYEALGPAGVDIYTMTCEYAAQQGLYVLGDIKRGEIVVIKTEDTGETLIKRVKGLPGDTIDFLLMPYSWKLSMGEYKVPDNSLYVLGDNRPVSQDSRDFGAVQKSDVLGKVVVFGNEPWLFGVVGVAVLSLIASGIAALTDKKGRQVAT